MSDTPETDEALFDYDSQCEYWVDAEFARKLERERNALKKQLSEIEGYWVDEIKKAIEFRSKLAASLVERDEYKRRWKDWERWAKQMVQYSRIVPLDTDTVGFRNTLTRWMQEMKDAK